MQFLHTPFWFSLYFVSQGFSLSGFNHTGLMDARDEPFGCEPGLSGSAATSWQLD